MTNFKQLFIIWFLLTSTCFSWSSENINENKYVLIIDHLRTRSPSAIIPFKWNGQTWESLSDSQPINQDVYASKKWISKYTAEPPVKLDPNSCNFKELTWFRRPVYCLGPSSKIDQGKPSTEFSGWKYEPLPRPIVYVESVEPRKAFILKSVSIDNGLAKKVKELFVKDNKYAYNCVSAEQPSNPKARLKVALKHLKTVSQFLIGKDGYIITIELKDSLLKCDGPPSEPWYQKSYLVLPNKTIRYLGNSMVPLEAGDFNGDGKNEIIFFYSGYNEDGYILFSDNYCRTEKFLWKYH